MMLQYEVQKEAYGKQYYTKRPSHFFALKQLPGNNEQYHGNHTLNKAADFYVAENKVVQPRHRQEGCNEYDDSNETHNTNSAVGNVLSDRFIFDFDRPPLYFLHNERLYCII